VRGAGLLLVLGLLQDKPALFEERGKLVCLIEEMKEKYQAQAGPVHEHLAGFRVEGGSGARYLTLYRNALSEALFVDKRFKEHELRLTGRVFPATSLLEVSRFQWYRDGKLFDVSYWCEVCDPGRGPGAVLLLPGKSGIAGVAGRRNKAVILVARNEDRSYSRRGRGPVVQKTFVLGYRERIGHEEEGQATRRRPA